MHELKEIDLHVTSACNYSCSHCLVEAGRNGKRGLEISEIEKIVDDALKLGLEEVHLTGGEPSLREDLFDIIRLLKKKKLEVRLQTNGALLNPELLQKIKLSGVHQLMISLEGLNPKINDAIRGKGSFDKTYSAIKMACKAGLNVRVNSVVMNQNIDDLPKLSLELSKIGVKLHSFFYFSPLGRAKNDANQMVGPEKWEKFLDKLEAIKKKIGDSMDVVAEQVFIKTKDAKNADLSCKILSKEYVAILPDGKVYPCALFLNSPYELGNVKKESIKTIFESSPQWDFYASLQKDDICNCELSTKCKGGCKGYSYLIKKDLTKADPRCNDITKYIPLCPIYKKNLKTNKIAHSTVEACK